jgi:hypothetical protein
MIILGGIIGFIYFLYELESPSMGGILFRPNSDGIKEFSIGSLINIMIAPFRYINFWTDINLHSINWIITTGIGCLLYYFISYILYEII